MNTALTNTQLIEPYLFTLYINDGNLPLEDLIYYTGSEDMIDQLLEDNYIRIIDSLGEEVQTTVQLTSQGTLWVERKIQR